MKTTKILYNNINGIKSKKMSLKRIIEKEKPTVIGIAETKLKENEVVEIEGYEIKRIDRKSEGGGVLLAYKKCLKNITVVVREEQKEEEMLWIKINNTKIKLRIGIVYMPQEKDTKLEVIKGIYKKIEEEVQRAAENKECVIVMGDFNCKVGEAIQGNTQELSKGGRVLLSMCKKLGLTIVNQEKCCKGTWTRIVNEKKSVLDYFITTKNDIHTVDEMVIDEEKYNTPFRLNENNNIIYSDHCTMTMTMNLVDDSMEKEKERKYMSNEGYTNFRKTLEEKKIAEIVNETRFMESYSEWSDEVIQTIEECSTKKKKTRGWKVNRKLGKAKKNVQRMLKKMTLNKDQIQFYKMRKNLINEHIEKEHRKRTTNKCAMKLKKLRKKVK